jgi:hypothetical protein
LLFIFGVTNFWYFICYSKNKNIEKPVTKINQNFIFDFEKMINGKPIYLSDQYANDLKFDRNKENINEIKEIAKTDQMVDAKMILSIDRNKIVNITDVNMNFDNLTNENLNFDNVSVKDNIMYANNSDIVKSDNKILNNVHKVNSNDSIELNEIEFIRNNGSRDNF